MSDEFFYIEEVVTPELTGAKIEKWNQNFMKRTQNYKEERQRQAKKGQEIRIQEIEQHLKLAESKCNTLKGQVEHMRMMYTEMNTEETKTKPTNARNKEQSPNRHWRKGFEDSDEHRELKSISNVSTVPHRDTSNNKSDAVKSINNIITDITHSVNRLTNLQVHIGSSHILNDAVGIQTVKCSPRPDANNTPEKPYQSNLNTSALSLKSSHQMKGKKKAKVISTKHTSNKKESSASIMKKMKANYKQLDTLKKTKVSMTNSAIDASSSGAKKLPRRTRTQSLATRIVPVKHSRSSQDSNQNNDKLVELYHNSAVKMATASETELLQHKEPRVVKVEESFHQQCDSSSSTNQQQETQKSTQVHQLPYRAGVLPAIQEYEGASILNYNSRSYEEPTIASKLKQVANNYFRNDSFRSIPFVTAKSTSPSHNLGVNIQQVLSIIKGRKPISGLSPTLTYNIQLAANKLGSRPLSALVSTLGSRMTGQKNPCPLIRRYPNFSNLQEMARDIPEETVDEMSFEDDPDKVKGATIAASAIAADIQASGDVNTWTVDPSKSKDKCTCLPKPGVPFNEVYHKYNALPATGVFVTPKKLRKPWNPAQRYQRRDPLRSASKTSQINRRERSLKEVLKNLHDEFSRLNERYDELKKQLNNNGGDQELVQLLEQLERELQNKEDEITMVMTLYKEVLQLKQQVTLLKKRASACTIMSTAMPSQNPPMRQRTSSVNKDSNASGHLANLLRYVQQFQKSLKKPTL